MFEHAAESEDSAQTDQPKFESGRFERNKQRNLPQALLLGDSIIFQSKTSTKITQIKNISQFLKPQIEKSFNQDRTKNQLN